jgi:Domain of unknown function (DUF4476)
VHTTITMKKMLQLALVLFISIAAKAQQNYFVYVQTDNKQPFYIKLHNKLMSSSASGYLVIPKLTTGNYALTVGFAKDQSAQQSYNLSIGNSDAGYLLKNFGEKGWGLYNIQTMEISMNGSPAHTTAKANTEADEVFAATLSGVANTNLSVSKEFKPAQVKETPVSQITEEITQQKENSTISIIKKIQTINDFNGNTIIYSDKLNNKIDTIRIFIPIENEPSSKSTGVIKNIETEKAEQVRDKKFLDIELPNPNAKEKEKKEPIQKEEPDISNHTSQPLVKTGKPVLTFNSDCKANATDDDFFKTRKKMVAEDNDDDMVNAARKQFKQKCYSVEQIKNLCILFLSDAGKYKFFDAVYPYTNDTQNFVGLKSLLKDEYYIKRFKSMIHN